MWNTDNSKLFVNRLAFHAKAWGYGLAVGGSVAINGCSENDIDIVLFDLKRDNYNHHSGFLEEIQREMGLKMQGAVDHSEHGDDKLIYVFRNAWGRKIDLFFVNMKFFSRMNGVPVLKRKILKTT